MTLELRQLDYNNATSDQLEICAAFPRKARLIFADPPYNQGVKYADDPTGDKLSDKGYEDLCYKACATLRGFLATGGTFWWMCPERHADWTGMMLEQLIGPRLCRIVWHETFAQYQQRKLTEDYRFIFVHTITHGLTMKQVQPLLTFNGDDIRIPSKRQEMGDKRADPRGRVPGQVWPVRRLQGTSVDRIDWHPCQLAPEMMDRIIKGWSNPGDWVIDGFAGSGVMLARALALGRNALGIDQSQTYIEKIRERLST